MLVEGCRIGLPRLWLQDKHASGKEQLECACEQALEAIIAPVEMNPLRDAETQDGVKSALERRIQHIATTA